MCAFTTISSASAATPSTISVAAVTATQLSSLRLGALAHDLERAVRPQIAQAQPGRLRDPQSAIEQEQARGAGLNRWHRG